MTRALGALLCAAAAIAGGPVEEGDRALSERRYADAIRSYREAEARDGPSALLLFRLGNAYAGSSDLGRAVLCYERARLLAPRDAGIRGALAEARRAARLEGDLDRGWRDFHRYLTATEWTVTGLAAVALLLVALLGRPRLSRQAVVRLAATGFLIALPAATAVAKHALDRDRAVVVAAQRLLRAPDAAAEAAGTVRPGEVVRIGRASAGFVLVSAPGGSGWLPRPSVDPITP